MEVAQTQGGFSPRALRVALDSSPLWGAGQVEDTVNLLGHALHKALGVIARQQGRGLAEVAMEAGAELVGGPLSLKAALDLDWDDPAAISQALRAVLATLETVETWLDGAQAPPRRPSLGPAQSRGGRAGAYAGCGDERRGTPTLRHGVSRDRRISLEDAQMRHGRKSRRVRVDGYKRHVVHDLDTGLVCAVGVTPANAPEASVTDALDLDLAAFQLPVAGWAELHIDRAYLSSAWVRERPETLAMYCKAWPVRNRRPLSQDGLHPGLGAAAAPLPTPDRGALHPGRHRPLPGSHVCGLSAARALHHQRPWPQRPHPSR